MDEDKTRRTFLIGGVSAGAIALAGCASEDGDDANGDDTNGDDQNGNGETENGADDEVPSYEVWALDQGTDTIYLYEPDSDGYGEHGDDVDATDLFAHAETIDLNEVLDDEGPIIPHMIDFTSDYEYAAIACTAGARTLVFRTDDHELVGEIETGPRSHFAGFSPDDAYVHVDVMGDPDEEYGWITRVETDLENEEFEEVDRIDFSDSDIVDDDVWPARPICHQYDPSGRSFHTLGPGHGDAGLVIVDHDDFSVERAYPGEEVPTNCGTMPHPSEEKFYLTAGRPSNPEEDDEGVGEYYVYDTADDEILVDGESTEGVDAHGFWFTPDGEELWVLNRESNDGVVVDPDTDEVEGGIDAFGPAQSDDPEESDAPDIMWATPDGRYVLVTLRGPAPLSGDPHAATGVTPGFSVLDTESKEIVDVVEPDPIDEYDDEDIQAVRDEEDDAPPIPDFHGIGVRPTGDFDTEIDTSPPY